jgi:hypothetical protein
MSFDTTEAEPEEDIFYDALPSFDKVEVTLDKAEPIPFHRNVQVK